MVAAALPWWRSPSWFAPVGFAIAAPSAVYLLYGNAISSALERRFYAGRRLQDGSFVAELAQPALTSVGDRRDWHDDAEGKWYRGVVTARVDEAEETYCPGAVVVEFAAITKQSKAVVVKAVTGASKQAVLSAGGSAKQGWQLSKVGGQKVTDLVDMSDTAKLRVFVEQLAVGEPGALTYCRTPGVQRASAAHWRDRQQRDLGVAAGDGAGVHEQAARR